MDFFGSTARVVSTEPRNQGVQGKSRKLIDLEKIWGNFKIIIVFTLGDFSFKNLYKLPFPGAINQEKVILLREIRGKS